MILLQPQLKLRGLVEPALVHRLPFLSPPGLELLCDTFASG